MRHRWELTLSGREHLLWTLTSQAKMDTDVAPDERSTKELFTLIEEFLQYHNFSNTLQVCAHHSLAR